MKKGKSRGEAERVAPRREERGGAAPSTNRRRGRPWRRPAEAEARRREILDAALTVFAKHGFAAARLDDVAKRAGVAKGTLYLYFKDKEALFEELIRGAVGPVMERVAALAAEPALPTKELLQRMFSLFVSEILATDRKLLVHLIIAEGRRFPRLVDFYHREVVSRGLSMARMIAARGVERGELESKALARYPQLLMAPLVLSLVWENLFSRIEPLDVEGLFAAHAEVLTAARGVRRK